MERSPGPRPPSYPMLSKVYRLTERGLRLRYHGLDQLADAPSLPIAGIEAYPPASPWVLLENGRLALLWLLASASVHACMFPCDRCGFAQIKKSDS
jgi:hypothetical protein